MLAEAELQEYLDEIRKEVCSRCVERPAGGPPCEPLGKPCGVELHLEKLIDAVHDVHSGLIGPYLEAARTVGVPVDGVLAGIEAHLGDWGLGSVSETADGAPPHAATGCPFQAWSVAEVLRVRRAAGDEPTTATESDRMVVNA